MTQRVSSEAGFSLIETLMALFIIGMLSVGGGALLMQTLQAGKQTAAHAEMITDMQVSHALMRDDIASLVRRKSRSSDGFGAPQGFVGHGGLEGDVVFSFVRGGWVQPKGSDLARSDLQRLEYRVERGRLIRKAWLRPDPVTDTPFTERVMAQGFDSIEIRYAVQDVWLEAWGADALSGEVQESQFAPDAIEIVLHYPGGTAFRQVFLTGARS